MLRDHAIFAFHRHQQLGDAALLDDAIRDMREASSLTPPTHIDRPQQLRDLGAFLLDRFTLSGDVVDLEECINLLNEVLQKTSNHGRLHANTNLNLGLAYWETFSQSENKPADRLKRAFDVFVAVIESPAALPFDKFSAFGNLVAVYLCLGNPAGAAGMVSEWAALMPRVVPQSLDIPDKQYILAQLSNVASEMAAILLSVDESPYRVLSVLESSRGIIMSSLGAIRAPVSDLQKVDRYLAEDYLRCRDALDKSTVFQQHADQRYEADKKFQESIAAIRKVPGFDRFLLPPTEDEFKAYASSGPIAVLNVNKRRRDALIIQRSGLSVVSLPNLHIEDIHRLNLA